MIKKIGSLFFLCWFVCISAVPSIRIEVSDLHDNALKTAGVGVPFLVKVIVSGDVQSLPEPKSPSWNGLDVMSHATSSSIRSINGTMTVKKQHRYTVSAREIGTYHIGPVSITMEGDRFSSNRVSIDVAQQQELLVAHSQSKDVKLSMTVDKENVVVGEQVRFSLRFYYLDDETSLEHIQKPTFKECTVDDLKGPHTGTQVIDGTSYSYLEWHTTFFPNDVGKLVIPAVEARYHIPEKDRLSPFDFFSMSGFFGRDTKKNTYSNAVSLVVHALPYHDPPIDAVGQYKSVYLKARNTHAQTGEGIVVTVELIGDENIKMLKHPRLVLPDHMTSYESNSTTQVLDRNKTLYKRDFEYVMQVINEGKYIIPAQEFTYYNTKKHDYVTLYTKPLALDIVPGKKEQISHLQNAEKKSKTSIASLSVLPLLDGSVHVVPMHYIPWNIFGLLLFIPIAFLCSLRLYYYAHCIYSARGPKRRYKRIFMKTRKELAFLRRTGNTAGIYRLFVDIFSTRCGVERHVVTEPFIERLLHKKGFVDDDILNWKRFFTLIAQASFALQDQDCKNELFDQAYAWIKRLENLL